MRSFIAVMATVALCLAAGASAQTYTVLHEFGVVEGDGLLSIGALVSDGAKLYGITIWGGANDGGTIYSMNPDGSGYSILHSFDSSVYPTGGLALSDGVLYGTTEEGGANDGGMIYSIKTDGSAFTVVFSFPLSTYYPDPSPVTVSGDSIYGFLDEDPEGTYYGGIAYSIKTDGTGYTVLTGFEGSPEDGESPNGMPLFEGGVLYGATQWGGTYLVGAGTLFSLPAAGGSHSILHNFSGNDGFGPTGNLISDGSRLYGMTSIMAYINRASGLAKTDSPFLGTSTIFAVDKDGANFKTLHTFENASILQRGTKRVSIQQSGGVARDGNRLFGTSGSWLGYTRGGPSLGPDAGTIFALNTDGTGYTELYLFDGLIGGSGTAPSGTPLVLNGALYGATTLGGTEDEGVIYSFTIPPVPPIDLTPNKTTFFSTDHIAARANIAAIPSPCIPFVRIVPPSGPALYCVQGQGFTETPTPFLGFPGVVTVPAPIYDYPVFDAQFRGMATGSYLLEGGAIDPAKTTDLLNPVYVGAVDSQTLVIQ